MKSSSKIWTTRLAGLAIAAAILAEAPTAAAQGFSVVVHPSNPVKNLSLTDLREMFRGTVTHWQSRTKIVLAQRGAGSPANGFLMGRLLNTSWQDYKRSLEGLEFMGQEPVIVRVLNSDAAACKFVFNVPSAVAVIESALMSAPECHDVRILKIDGLLPGQEGYRLK